MASNQEKLDLRTSPIFDAESGERLKLVRMSMLMDQKSMGEKLGISQQQLSKLEQGKLEQPPFNMARFKAIFGEMYTYILLGSAPRRHISPGHVRSNYWTVKLKLRRKPGSGAWKKERDRLK